MLFDKSLPDARKTAINCGMIDLIFVRWLIFIGDLRFRCGMACYTNKCLVRFGDRFGVVHFWYQILIIRLQYGTFGLQYIECLFKHDWGNSSKKKKNLLKLYFEELDESILLYRHSNKRIKAYENRNLIKFRMKWRPLHALSKVSKNVCAWGLSIIQHSKTNILKIFNQKI